MVTLNPTLIPYNLDIIVYQGATFNPTYTFKDKETGALVNFTGCTARMKAKVGYESTETEINLTTENGGIVLGGTAGTIRLLLSATATTALDAGAYYYDLEVINASAEVVRVLQGIITVSAEVTK